MRKREGNKNVKLYMLGNKENKKGKRIGKNCEGENTTNYMKKNSSVRKKRNCKARRIK